MTYRRRVWRPAVSGSYLTIGHVSFTLQTLMRLLCGCLAADLAVGVIMAQQVYRTPGLDFSPYLNGQNPSQNLPVSPTQIQQRMAVIAPYTKGIRTFGCLNGLAKAGQIAHGLGLMAAIGAWISQDLSANNKEIACAVATANAGYADMIIVGTEVLRRGDVSERQLLAYLQQVRQQVSATVPVTTVDVYNQLLAHPAVVQASDSVMANIYPYWEGYPVETAVSAVATAYQKLVAAASGKQVVIAETGWPSGGNSVGAAVPSVANSANYFLGFVSWARANNVPYYYFDSFDQLWKASEEGPQGAFWGLWDQYGVLKPGMQSVFDGIVISIPKLNPEACDGSGVPSIGLTFVDAIGGAGPAYGVVHYVKPSDYKTALYIYIDGLGWWTKPFFAQPLTTILADCTFVAPIITGGSDSQASRIRAYLVPNGYAPPILNGQSALPVELEGYPVSEMDRSPDNVCGTIISNGTGLAGVTVSIAGSSSLRAQTVGSGGRYCFSSLAAGGTYTLTASKSDYSVSPPQTISNLSGSNTIPFLATSNRDLDANGKPDLLWQNSDGTVVVWYMGGADGSVYQSAKALAGQTSVWHLVATADLNGDGTPDLLWQHTDGTVVVWYMGGADGSVYQSAKVFAGPASMWHLVSAVDMNGDGKPDLLWQHNDGTVVIWYMGGANGSVYEGGKTLSGPSSVWHLVAVADLDQNGHADLLWQHTDGTVAVWYMGGTDGSVYQSGKAIAGPAVGWHVTTSADLDGNGKPDIIWQNDDGTAVVWYMGGADGSVYQSAKTLAGPSSAWHVKGH